MLQTGPAFAESAPKLVTKWLDLGVALLNVNTIPSQVQNLLKMQINSCKNTGEERMLFAGIRKKKIRKLCYKAGV